MTIAPPTPYEYAADLLDPPEDPYIADPDGWTASRLGEHTTDDQKRVMRSVVEHRYTAVRSCHDVGKSFSASRLATWWIDVHPPGEAFVVTTAPTAPQVGAILWREIGRAHRMGKLPGYVTGKNEWKLTWGVGRERTAELVAYGRKPADYDPSGFTGIHARYVLVIIDEACGVPKALYEAVDSLATNEHARVLAIGNPDDPASYFAEVCKPRSGWNLIHIDALTTPNFTREAIAKHPELRRYMIQQGIKPSTEKIPDRLRDMLVSPTWVAERIKRWGVDSPVFASKVRGQFPIVGIDTLIHPHWVTLAQARETVPQPFMSRMGVDVARYGTDHTVILLRQGGHCRVIEDIPYGPVTEVAGLVQQHGYATSNPGPVACVDDVGVGGGVTDILVEDKYPCIPIIGGAAATQLLPNGKPRFINKRAELYWNLREALAGASGTGEDGWLDLDPDDDELAAQLTNVKYGVNRHGQIWVETKEEMKSRGVASPDRADALCYSVAPDELRTTSHVRKDAMLTHDLLETQW